MDNQSPITMWAWRWCQYRRNWAYCRWIINNHTSILIELQLMSHEYSDKPKFQFLKQKQMILILSPSNPRRRKNAQVSPKTKLKSLEELLVGWCLPWLVKPYPWRRLPCVYQRSLFVFRYTFLSFFQLGRFLLLLKKFSSSNREVVLLH